MSTNWSNNTFAAIALNRQGKALVQYTKNKTQNQNRAALLFRKSVKKMAASKVFEKLDNLESLKKLAEGKDRARIVAGIDKEIAALNNNTSNSNTIIKGDIGNPREDDNNSSENPLMSTDARNRRPQFQADSSTRKRKNCCFNPSNSTRWWTSRKRRSPIWQKNRPNRNWH